jgi:hypothetical protein
MPSASAAAREGFGEIAVLGLSRLDLCHSWIGASAATSFPTTAPRFRAFSECGDTDRTPPILRYPLLVFPQLLPNSREFVTNRHNVGAWGISGELDDLQLMRLVEPTISRHFNGLDGEGFSLLVKHALLEALLG